MEIRLARFAPIEPADPEKLRIRQVCTILFVWRPAHSHDPFPSHSPASRTIQWSGLQRNLQQAGQIMRSCTEPSGRAAGVAGRRGRRGGRRALGRSLGFDRRLGGRRRLGWVAAASRRRIRGLRARHARHRCGRPEYDARDPHSDRVQLLLHFFSIPGRRPMVWKSGLNDRCSSLAQGLSHCPSGDSQPWKVHLAPCRPWPLHKPHLPLVP